MGYPVFNLFLLFFGPHLTWALTGYDCQDPHVKITSYATTDVQPCRPPAIQSTGRSTVDVQVVQKRMMVPIQAFRCALQFQQTITHCGMHSHSAEVYEGSRHLTHTFSTHECQHLIQSNRLRYPYRSDTEFVFRPSVKNTGYIVVAGTVNKAGDCAGASYGEYSAVLVTHTFTVFYETISASLDIDHALIHFPNQLRCPVKPSFCHDDYLGDFFWTEKHVSPCDYSYYQVLYSGPAKLHSLQDHNTDTTYKVVTVRHTAYLYSLLLTGKSVPCLHEMSTTDQPNIFVSFHKDLIPQQTASSNDTANVNPWSFFNTKIFYVAAHIGEQLEILYRDLLFHMCQLKRVSLMNLLTFAHTDPQGFAYALTQQPGHTSYLAGELAHVVQCQPKSNLTYRSTDRCYSELPVVYDGKPAFLSPRSRLIVYHAHEVECSTLFPVAFNLSNIWTITTRQPLPTVAPNKLDPNIQPTFRFQYDATLSSGGLYSRTQLEAYSRTLQFNQERDAIASVLLNTLNDPSTDTQNLHFGRLLDHETLQRSIRSTFASFISRMTSFGIFVSTTIGIITLIKLCVTVLEIFINLTSIYRIYGFSYRLFCALFHSATAALLYTFKKPPASDPPPYKATLEKEDSGSPTFSSHRNRDLYPLLPPKPSPTNPVYTETLVFKGPLPEDSSVPTQV